MDFDPRITSDGMGYGAAYGHCNFHFGHVHDVFDEDAKNEEACVQALKHLIAKADTEIRGLEDELAILQCQRKWAEFDEQKNPYEVCCAAFKRRIDSLTSFLQKLRNGNLSHSHCVFTSLETQRPAEKICDIINAVMKNNFTEPDEQVGDLNNENNPVVTSASSVIDTDLAEEATASESSLESERQKSTPERLGEGAETVPEESTPEAARNSSMELSELKSMDASNAEVPTKSENAGCASEGRSRFLTSIETVISQSPYQVSDDEALSEATASQHEQSETCMKGSKTGGNGSTYLGVKTEEIVMDEQAGHYTSLHDSAGSDSRAPDNKVKEPVEDYPTLANQTKSVNDLEIAYGSQKSTSSCVLKSTGQKVQRKFSNDPQLMPEPQRKSKKRKPLANEDKIEQSPSPSSEIEGRSSSLPVANWRKILKTEQVVFCGNPTQAPETKIRLPKGASIKFSSIRSPKVKIAKAVLGAKENLVADSLDRVNLGLKSASSVELKSSGITSDCDNPDTVGSSTPEVWKMTASPSIDLETLKQSLCEDPDYLSKQNVPKLKEIVRHCKLRGVTKLKKEEIIQKLISFLTEDSTIHHVSADSVSRTRDLERKDQLVSADSASGTEDLERKHHHVSAESASRSQDLATKSRHVSPDSASRMQDLETKYPQVSADSASRMQDLETKNLQVSTNSLPRAQDLETEDPAEAQVAVVDQSQCS